MLSRKLHECGLIRLSDVEGPNQLAALGSKGIELVSDGHGRSAMGGTTSSHVAYLSTGGRRPDMGRPARFRGIPAGQTCEASEHSFSWNCLLKDSFSSFLHGRNTRQLRPWRVQLKDTLGRCRPNAPRSEAGAARNPRSQRRVNSSRAGRNSGTVSRLDLAQLPSSRVPRCGFAAWERPEFGGTSAPCAMSDPR